MSVAVRRESSVIVWCPGRCCRVQHGDVGLLCGNLFAVCSPCLLRSALPFCVPFTHRILSTQIATTQILPRTQRCLHSCQPGWCCSKVMLLMQVVTLRCAVSLGLVVPQMCQDGYFALDQK